MRRRGLARRTLGVLAATVALAVVGVGSGEVGAQSVPAVMIDRALVHPGEEVVVTLTSWSDPIVTVSVCGNSARRGSSDCSQVASQGVGINRDGTPTLTGYTITLPPVPCPCVVRAFSATQDAVALAPVEIIGAPTAPVSGDANEPPVKVWIEARRASGGVLGALRSALGGPTGYEVTVSVHNRTAEPLDGVEVAGAATRGDADVASLALPDPGRLAPGQTWQHVVRSTLPAPVVGDFAWEVTASGAGPAVHAAAQTKAAPIVLVVLVALFAGDLTAIALRPLRRRRLAANLRLVAVGRQPPVHEAVIGRP